jgi:hypothetical protein
MGGDGGLCPPRVPRSPRGYLGEKELALFRVDRAESGPSG